MADEIFQGQIQPNLDGKYNWYTKQMKSINSEQNEPDSNILLCQSRQSKQEGWLFPHS